MERIWAIYSFTHRDWTLNFCVIFFFNSFHQTFYSILQMNIHISIPFETLFVLNVALLYVCWVTATMLRWLRHNLTYFAKYCFSFCCLCHRFFSTHSTHAVSHPFAIEIYFNLVECFFLFAVRLNFLCVCFFSLVRLFVRSYK